MKELIEEYKRRIDTVNELLEKKNSGSINDEKRQSRLETKRGLYRTFVHELKQLQKTKYYVFGVWGDVDPIITIPFNTPEERDAEARRINDTADLSSMDESGIFHLDIDAEGMPTVGTYTKDNLNREGPTDAEIEQFKDDWGQTDHEISVNLNLKEENIDDEPLMDNYFWIPNDMIWCSKHSSFFTKREQEIADFLIKVISRID